jgi:7-cyano-7-deazaguanine synthase
MALATKEGKSVIALFVDHGQPAATAEMRASKAVADYFRATHMSLIVKPLRFGLGEILGRNMMLAHLGLLLAGGEPIDVVALGIHAGTPYKDCSPDFTKLVSTSFEFHTGGTVSFSAPFVDRTKQDVFGLATSLNVPISATHSCEAGDGECGVCPSCLDRRELLAGPQ